jgi:uncharacterized protein YaiI (UPF0178 family)
MKVLVDADSCPKPARELILRRAAKLNIRIIFAANRPIPNEDLAEMEICDAAQNSADDRLVELAEEGDLALTRDVPLAKRLVEKGVFVLDDRGRVFTKNNINELLSLRNFTVGLADNGLEFERISNYSKKDLKTFADSLDRLLTKILKVTSKNSF